MVEPGPLFALEASEARAIVDVLRNASFDDEHIAATLRSDEVTATAERRLAIQRHRTSGGTTLDTLIRLLVLGLSVDADAAREALAPLRFERLLTCGLLVGGGAGMVQAAVQLRCFQDLVVAWDFPRRDAAGRLPAEFVMGISPSSLGLAGFTRRERVSSVLDLGTGCGIQAMLAARHGDVVVATDANRRAVAMTRFNAMLNGITNVTSALGSMFEPVDDRRFDLIVSNPPFIVSPDSEHLFLSTERPLDDLCRQLTREATNHLNEGGWCQFLANWAVGADESWRDHVQEWVAGTGCDVLALRRSSQAIDTYAAEWIEPTAEGLAFDDAFDRWIDYYERADVAAIGFGLITMRRRTSGAPNWFVGENAPDEITYPAGDAIVEAFARHDFLDAHTSDEALLAARLHVASDATMTQRFRLRDGGWAPIEALVRRDRGLRYGFDVDAAGVALLAHADGTSTLRDVLTAVAAEFSVAAAALLDDGPAIARSLVERGVLIPATS
jgi:methylase of polypeptide subunit release factors